MKNFLGSSISKDSLMDTRNGSKSHCDWIKLNVDQSGFYRVKYDEELLAKLRYAIENKYLSATDRFGILDDSFAVCMGRQQSLTSLLTLMSAYRAEDDYTVLSNLISICYKIERIPTNAVPDLVALIKQSFINPLQNSAKLFELVICYKIERIAANAVPDLVALIKQFFINLLQNSAEKLGWEPKAGESHLDAMLRCEIWLPSQCSDMK